GFAASGGLPLIGAGPTLEATPIPTPIPTPNWRAPLLASYLEACGESLDRSELSGMSVSQATAFVEEEIQDCRDKGDDGKGKGRGNGNGNSGGPGRD
ncbi:MAG TPA: hypothetical protein VFH90_06515, partial [Candidatus Limnocylindria bacterium]|nr:hypothetical protein [Candidatus Limnocylindria bacterium]